MTLSDVSRKLPGFGWILLIYFCFKWIQRTVEAMQHGLDLPTALSSVLESRHFWLSDILWYVVLLVMILLYFSRRPPVTPQMPNVTLEGMKRDRRNYTYIFLFIILVTMGLVTYRLATGVQYSPDRLGFYVLLWVAGILFLIHQMRTPIDEDTKEQYRELAQAMVTQTTDRLHKDERTQWLNGLTAVITLKWLVLAIIFGGILFDILITHLWPVRTFAELLIAASVWFVVRTRLNREQ